MPHPARFLPSTRRLQNRIIVFLSRHGRILFSLFILLLIWGYANTGSARMGGGGGSSGGDDGDIFALVELVFYIFLYIPFPFNFLVAGIVIALIWWVNSETKKGSVLNGLPSSQKALVRNAKQILAFSKERPDFDEAGFIEKVRKAFLDIQAAWAGMNIAPVRRFLSDGMYQRVQTQFAMMRVLNQQNTIESVEIQGIAIDRIETDGMHDVIHVAILARSKEHFTSKTYPNLDSHIHEEFVEYWSFIRKHGASGKDMYQTTNCPNCGGDVSNLGEISRCPYCGTLTNSGEHDWVLAKITPADDYRLQSRRKAMTSALMDKLETIADDDPEFSVLKLEDKASNAFLQLETARILKNPAYVRRFTSDAFHERFSAQLAQEPDFVYNRIYLNDVTLVGAMEKDNAHVLAVSVRYSFQRVQLSGDRALPLDPVVTSDRRVLLLKRDVRAATAQGSLYTHQCPACGGTLGDTTDIACPYCGGELNSPRHEWIVEDVMSTAQYTDFYVQNQQDFAAGVLPAKLEKLMKVRDYAFNNVLVMLAADGVFAQPELEFAHKLAKRWGYDPKRLDGMLELASNNKLSLRIPEKPKDREKVYKMMCKAAAADGAIAPQEQALLDFYRVQAQLG